MNYKTLLSAWLLLLTALTLPTTSTKANDLGTITIEQESPNGIIGDWVLIKPNHKQLALKSDRYTLKDASAGTYTLIAHPPSGAETMINIFIDQDLLETKNQPQASFTMEPNVNYRLRISYNFTRTGKIGVNSRPPGIGFTLKGPNQLVQTGVTPAALSDMPEGQYSVQYDDIPDCPKAAALSDKLIVNGRINFDITFECEGIANMAVQKEYERTFEFVTTNVDGNPITFNDLPTAAWFAPFSSKVIKTGIMSGYRNASGQPTGKFGPSDSINLAQLAKIAHELADIDETQTSGRSKNELARGQWFEKYFASAERLHWQVFTAARLNPSRPATRAEVVATLLQALDVPRQWATGDLFTDVRRNTPYAHSIETASEAGIVSGFTDSDGNSTGKFGPEQGVNRAEMSKIVSQAIEVYLSE